MIEEQVAKRAAAADAESASARRRPPRPTATADLGQDAAGAGGAPEPKKIDIGTVAAIGVAVGGIGDLLLRASWRRSSAWASGCRSASSALMLRHLGPVDADRVAEAAAAQPRARSSTPTAGPINGRVKINVPFGGALTGVAALPSGAERSLKDPTRRSAAPGGSTWRPLIVLLLGFLCTWASWTPTCPRRPAASRSSATRRPLLARSSRPRAPVGPPCSLW